MHMRMDNIPNLVRNSISGLIKERVDEVLVVDIGSNLKMLNVELRDGIKISALKIIDLPLDKREEFIVNSLSDFIKENNIRHNNAILSPSLKSLFIKRIRLPAIPKKELTEAIKWQLKDEARFDLSDAACDFSIVKEKDREDGSKIYDVISVLAPAQEIRPYVLLLKQAGLNCLAVVPLAFGYTKLAKGQAIGVMHIEEKTSYITIQQEENLEFYRELPLSISKLTDALKGALVSDRGRVELSAEEANDVLFTIGIPQQDVFYKDKLSSGQILSLLRPVLERMVQEIKRSLAYYSSEFQGPALNKIMIAGKGAEIPNLEEFLGRELSLDIRKMSLEDKNIASPDIKSEMLAEAYGDFGLALDWRHNINLLPREFRAEKFEKLQKVSLRWIAFIVFALLIFSYSLAKVGVKAYQKRLDYTLLHLQALSEIEQAEIKLNEFNKFIAEIRNQCPPVSTALKKISSIAGRDLFLESFSLNSEAKTIFISGFVRSSQKNPGAILTRFAKDMESSSYFVNTSISSMEEIQQEGEGINAIKFNLTSKLR